MELKNEQQAVAVYHLGDEIYEMAAELEKAEAIAHAVCDEYFRSHTEDTLEGRTAITHDHDHYRVYAEVVIDYLFSIRKKLESLQALEDAGMQLVEQQKKTGAA